jgi:hypothetical protein
LSAASWRPIEVQFEWQQWAVFCFVPNKSVNHSRISVGSLFYQVGLVRLIRRSILRDAVQANLFHRLYFVVAQAAGVASFIAAHNKSLNTGLAIRSRSLFNTGCSQPVKQTLYLRRTYS